MVKNNKEIIQEIKEKERKRKIQIYMMQKILVVTTGTIAIISFIVSLAFLTDMSVTGRVAKEFGDNSYGNIAGVIIITLISFIWLVLMILWLRKVRKQMMKELEI